MALGKEVTYPRLHRTGVVVPRQDIGCNVDQNTKR